MTTTQTETLNAIRDLGPCDPQNLCTALGVSKSSMQARLAGLLRAGLVKRALADSDGTRGRRPYVWSVVEP
jgi:predicted transcriptional regulator